MSPLTFPAWRRRVLGVQRLRAPRRSRWRRWPRRATHTTHGLPGDGSLLRDQLEARPFASAVSASQPLLPASWPRTHLQPLGLGSSRDGVWECALALPPPRGDVGKPRHFRGRGDQRITHSLRAYQGRELCILASGGLPAEPGMRHADSGARPTQPPRSARGHLVCRHCHHIQAAPLLAPAGCPGTELAWCAHSVPREGQEKQDSSCACSSLCWRLAPSSAGGPTVRTNDRRVAGHLFARGHGVRTPSPKSKIAGPGSTCTCTEAPLPATRGSCCGPTGALPAACAEARITHRRAHLGEDITWWLRTVTLLYPMDACDLAVLKALAQLRMSRRGRPLQGHVGCWLNVYRALCRSASWPDA